MKTLASNMMKTSRWPMYLLASIAILGSGSNVYLLSNLALSGKLTLEGIDSDSYGVRDNIKVAGNSADKNAIFPASESINNSLYCLDQKVKDPSSKVYFLESQVVNTAEGVKASMKLNKTFKVLPLNIENKPRFLIKDSRDFSSHRFLASYFYPDLVSRNKIDRDFYEYIETLMSPIKDNTCSNKNDEKEQLELSQKDFVV